jgi:hypothetical protein
MALRGEIVDFIGLNFGNQGRSDDRISQIAVIQEKTNIIPCGSL